MKKSFPIRPLLLFFSLLLLFIGRARAVDTPSGVIQIENRHDAADAFSCDVKLSGKTIRGGAFAVLFAESGRMKALYAYPAAETFQISLNGVSKTDFIKIIWTDEDYRPSASPAVLRMSGNNAQAYEDFTKQLAAALPYGGASGSSDAENPYASARLLVSAETLPDLSGYKDKATVISGPNHFHVLQFPDPATAKQCEKYLQSCPSVRYVEPDAVMRAGADGNGDASRGTRSWGVGKSGLGDFVENLRQRGQNHSVIVAAVDSGVEIDHPFLENRLVAGFDYVDYDDIPQDEHGHGTHVAGIIADCTRNMDVNIMPVRVLDAFNFGSYLNIASGVRYAADHGANIINLSLGSATHSQTIEDAVNYALSKNVTVVTAAGNYNGNVAHFCPAHMENCVTVAAVNQDLRRFELSNYGEAVDIAAPGVDIESSVLKGKYDEMSGTSMAAPHVSAAAALLMCERGSALTPNQISGLLRGAADDLGEPGKDVYFGAGFLNMRPFIVHSAYALLYADGELVFQKDSAPAPDRELVKAYPVAVSGDAGGQYAAWYERRADIRKVTFTESIRPASTALWFYGCDNLTEIQGLANLDASELTDMSQMFARCASLRTLDLTALEVGGVQKMNGMFFFCDALTELDLTGWNTANVSDTRDMFMACGALKTIYASDTFRTDGVTEGDGMFGGCTSLIGGAGTKYDGAHTDKEYARMDGGASAPGYFTDKNAPTQVYALLYGDGTMVFQYGDAPESDKTLSKTYKVDLDAVYTKTVDYSGIWVSTPWFYESKSVRVVNFADKISPTATAHWFDTCQNLTQINNIQNLDTAKVTNMSGMFARCSGLTSLDLSHFNTANVTDMSSMFFNCRELTALDLSHIDTVNVTNMQGMFENCSGLTSLDLSHFNTANVTDMNYMFENCSGLTALDASRFNTANVKTMNKMFFNCSGLKTLDVSHWDNANATDMEAMFAYCKGLTALDLSHFNTANVTDMSEMFSGCSGLTRLDISGFDTANVTNMTSMFSNCSGLLTLDVSHFNAVGLKYMGGIFSNCSGLTELDVSHFDTANVENMDYVFYQCGKLKTIYASEQFTTISALETSAHNTRTMFEACTSLVGGSGTKYDGAHTDKEYARIDGGASAPGYFTDKNAPIDSEAPIVTATQNTLSMDIVNGNVGNTCSGRVSLMFNEPLYQRDDAASPSTLRQIDGGPIVSSLRALPEYANFRAAASLMQSRSSPQIGIAENDENQIGTRSLSVELQLDHAENGSFLTFSSDLCDQYGNVRSSPLTVSIRIVQLTTQIDVDDKGDPI